jgi:hypothetical protein
MQKSGSPRWLVVVNIIKLIEESQGWLSVSVLPVARNPGTRNRKSRGMTSVNDFNAVTLRAGKQRKPKYR